MTFSSSRYLSPRSRPALLPRRHRYLLRSFLPQASSHGLDPHPPGRSLAHDDCSTEFQRTEVAIHSPDL